jgi:hypothetical protein
LFSTGSGVVALRQATELRYAHDRFVPQPKAGPSMPSSSDGSGVSLPMAAAAT